MQNIDAGSDTTSISLSGIIYALLKYPDTLAKLRAEVDDCITKNSLSDPPTYLETQAMPYLQAVIKEGLHLHSAAGFPMVRIVPHGGVEMCGRFFPEGNSLGINPWVAHANKDIFGDDAGQFRPERWLASKEATQRMDRYWLLFGAGSRTCTGKNISLLEISILIPQLVRKSDIHLADPHAELNCKYICFVKPKNMMVGVSKRSS